MRVPFIAWGPGLVPAGKTEATPVISYDFLPTFCAAAGVKSLPADLDGVSIWGLLTGGERPAPRTLYWHYPHYHPGGATPYSALRVGDERLIEFFEDGRLELYNLKDDVGEEQNLAEIKPARCAGTARATESVARESRSTTTDLQPGCRSGQGPRQSRQKESLSRPRHRNPPNPTYWPLKFPQPLRFSESAVSKRGGNVEVIGQGDFVCASARRSRVVRFCSQGSRPCSSFWVRLSSSAACWVGSPWPAGRSWPWSTRPKS
ncbi:MAG: hypothetical protein QM811_14885 [Pirellulales bacterium]